MKITFKRNQIIPLLRWLNDQPLAGSKSRERTRFVKLFEEILTSQENERLNITLKYAKKDDEGKPVMIEDVVTKEDGTTEPSGRMRYDVSTEDMGKLSSEYAEYMDTEVELDVEDVVLLNFIKRLLEKTTYKFSGALAFQYDEWLKAFENI